MSRGIFVMENVDAAEDQERYNAQLAVCRRARDRDEAERLLMMLGLHPADDSVTHCRECAGAMARRGQRLQPGRDGMCNVCSARLLRAARRAAP